MVLIATSFEAIADESGIRNIELLEKSFGLPSPLLKTFLELLGLQGAPVQTNSRDSKTLSGSAAHFVAVPI